ncbi:EAL domain-containing protein [Teichococcus aestuarii]|uniref:EAL domain-containing protein n=1 Tax=Teichococcus aestuarii TaxID=568898 RepID=UPI003618675F
MEARRALRARWRRLRRETRDLAVVLLAYLVTTALCLRLDAFEALVAFVAAHEAWEIDEWLTALLVLPFACTAYALRRLQDARREAARRRRAEALSRHLAVVDPLTGLPNRRRLMEALALRLESHGAAEAVAVLLIDLDRFKPVNDLHGHATGDRLLQAAAGRLAALARPEDMVARLGGDEFVILATLEAGAGRRGRRRHRRPAGTPRRHRAGAALRPGGAGRRGGRPAGAGGRQPGHRHPPRRPLPARGGAAPRRPRHVPRQGRGTRRHPHLRGGDGPADAGAAGAGGGAAPRHRGGGAGAALPAARGARRRARRVGAADRVRDAGALAAPGPWPVPPDRFIPLAEETGLIGPLTRQLLRRACRAAAARPAPLVLAVNVSPAAARPHPARHGGRSAGRKRPAPARLEIELTESALVENFDLARELLGALKALGIKLSLDDFGTGYSSLRHLRALPFDKIKVDRDFIRDMTQSSESSKIVAAVIGLSHSLGLPAVAEGIEDAGTATRLAEMGCDIGQGWLFGRPVAEAEAARLAAIGPLPEGPARLAG